MDKCERYDCNPVEQVRSKMGAGDYIGQDENYHAAVQLHDENKDDFRICCKICGLATPWNKRSITLPTGKVVDLQGEDDAPAVLWPKIVGEKKRRAAAQAAYDAAMKG